MVDIRQVNEMCRSSECDLYWVRTAICRMPALARLERTKSIRHAVPPNGTAGLARSAVNGISRFPSPPARTIARTLGLRALGDKRRAKSAGGASRSRTLPGLERL